MPQNRNVGVDVTSTDPKDLAKGAGYAAALSGAADAVFAKAIVLEIITTPDDLIDLFDDQPKEGDADSENPYHQKIQNESAARRAPRGAVIVKMLSDVASPQVLCAYPMMPSHIMFPVAVGELVWIYANGSDFYWLSRVAGSNISEDTNFTHVDRDMETPVAKEADAKDKQDQEKGALKRFIARFNNGLAGITGGATSAPPGFGPKEVKEQAVFTKSFTEAVPRYTPRPGDLVLQGSNNTLISFSTDRGWSKKDEDFSRSNAHQEVELGTGTIDIVAGRGRITNTEEEFVPSDEESEGTKPTRTGFRTIIADDGSIENNKLSKQNEETINQAEGDPDFYTDASRIYVSMHAKIDERLTLSESIPVLALETQPEDMTAPAVAIKSNEIRVVARHDGSIRIVKEKGDPSKDEDEGLGASIIMLPDGTIHITGEQIFLGKSKEEGGHEETEGPYTPGSMQPYIKFSVMKEYLEELHANIDKFCQTTLTHTTPGYGAPSPQLNKAVGDLKADMAANKAKIEELQSKRIFGE